jgi:multidrug efflux system membrane fusion protein
MNPQDATFVRTAPRQSAIPIQRPNRLGRWVVAVVVVGVLAAGTYWGIKWWRSSASAEAGSQRSLANQTIPVTAAKAWKGDIHIYLDGLGSVTPFNTDTIKTRVDGQIVKIYYTEGQDVKAGDPLIDIDPRPYRVMLEQAQGQLAKDQAALENAKIDLQRYKDAFTNGGAVSDQTVATQQATVDQDQGVVQSDQSQVDNANLDLVYCHITAPITGRIGLQLVNLGNFVQTSDTSGLAVITQLDPISVIFALPEDDVLQVFRKNGGVGLPVQAYDHDDLQLLTTGKVLAVDNQVNATTGTFNVKASFDNKDNALFPNQFVNAHLLARTIKNAVIVPTAAVQRGPDNTFAYVVDPADQTVHIRTIQVLPGEDDIVSVSGLQVGDIVVTDGTDKLQEGSKVTVTFGTYGSTTQPAATQPGTRKGHHHPPGSADTRSSQ